MRNIFSTVDRSYTSQIPHLNEHPASQSDLPTQIAALKSPSSSWRETGATNDSNIFVQPRCLTKNVVLAMSEKRCFMKIVEILNLANKVHEL